jgi:phage shock protein A
MIGAAKRSIIIEMSQDITNLNKTSEHVIAENSVLSEQLELSKNECIKLKAAIDVLESKITNYVNEIKNLKLSLESANNKPQVEDVITSDDQVGNVSKTSKKKKVAIEHLTNSQNENDDRPLNKYTKYWEADKIITNSLAI